MVKKKLVETLETMIAVPDPTHDITIDNMLAQWGRVPYAELSVLLVKLRYLAMVHQTHHWTVKNDHFYGDHLLFERLYGAVNSEIDDLAEKAIGLGSIDNVNLMLQVVQMAKMAKDYGTSMSMPIATSLVRLSMAAEINFLRCAAYCACLLKEKGQLTRGLDNLLQGFEDTHEGHVYLLKQRCGNA